MASQLSNQMSFPEFTLELDKVVNVASVRHYSPFRYPGGKTWLVPHVMRWLSCKRAKPARFIEPFLGGGIVSLTVAFEQLAETVIASEIDKDVAAVWRTMLNGKGRALADRIEAFDLTPEHVRAELNNSPRTIFDRAFATILRNRVQHGGILAEGASFMNAGENGKGIASRWYPQTLAKRIRNVGKIKQSITFKQMDAFELVAEYREDSRAVFFIDPPYTVAGRRLYTHWAIDHDRLFAAASRVRGDVLLTYDNTDEVRQLAAKYKFEAEEVAMKSRQHRGKTELLIGKDLSWARQ